MKWRKVRPGYYTSGKYVVQQWFRNRVWEASIRCEERIALTQSKATAKMAAEKHARGEQ